MDGKGLPALEAGKRWQARMMGIADIARNPDGEGQTPTREGMKLSQTLGILEKFRDRHVIPICLRSSLVRGIHVFPYQIS